MSELDLAVLALIPDATVDPVVDEVPLMHIPADDAIQDISLEDLVFEDAEPMAMLNTVELRLGDPINRGELSSDQISVNNLAMEDNDNAKEHQPEKNNNLIDVNAVVVIDAPRRGMIEIIPEEEEDIVIKPKRADVQHNLLIDEPDVEPRVIDPVIVIRADPGLVNPGINEANVVQPVIPIAPLPIKVGTQQVRDVNDVMINHLSNEVRAQNPHVYCAGQRAVDYHIVNLLLPKNSIVKDYFGGARTPKLLPDHAVHVHRPVITVADKNRLMLCQDKISNKSRYKDKRNPGPQPTKNKPTYCSHDFEKCFCAPSHTAGFLNDVYQSHVYETLNQWRETRHLYIIMKVFEPTYLGGRILVDHLAQSHDQGHWYRAGKQIVFAPNTNSTDVERNYVHDDLLPELFADNVVTRYGWTFTVLHRTSLGACASVILLGRPKANGVKNSVCAFKQPPTKYFGGTEDDVTAASAKYINVTIPNDSTALYTNELWFQFIRKRSSNTEADNLQVLLDNTNTGHIHFCRTCTLPYFHEHPLGKGAAAADAKSASAQHTQFDFDCPYNTCSNFNHVDCADDCRLPGHKAAILTLEKHTKKTVRLPQDAIDKFVREANDMLRAGHQPVVMYEDAPVNVTVDKLPAAEPKAVVNSVKLVTPTMSAALNEVPDGTYSDIHPTTKVMEVYQSIGNHYEKMTVVSSDNTGCYTFTIASDRFVVATKLLNRLITACRKCKSMEEASTLAAHLFSANHANVLTPSMVALVVQYVFQQIVAQRAMVATIEASALGHFTRDALNSRLKPYRNFLHAWHVYGLREASKLCWTRLNLFGCTAGTVDVGNLDLTVNNATALN